MLQLNIQSVLEVTSSGCYNGTSSVFNLLEMDFATQHVNMTIRAGKDLVEALKLLRLPDKSRGHIHPYPRVTFAPTPD